MRFFENKKIFQKMIIAILIVMTFSFIFSHSVQAKSNDFGGKLLKPIVSLLAALGDGTMDVLHQAVIQQDNAYIHIDLNSKEWSKVLLFVAAVVGAIIFAVITWGAGAVIEAVAASLGATIGGVTVGMLTTAAVAGAFVGGTWYTMEMMDDDFVLPLYAVTPEEIFSGEMAIFDVDFFNPNKEKRSGEDEKADKNSKSNSDEDQTSNFLSIAYKLRPTVASWYKTLRNIAIVGSLSILIYIAIRIIISSSSADKSKYKQRLYDWLISICLIFIMHYIMAGSNIFVKKLSGLLNSVQKPIYYSMIEIDDSSKKDNILKALEENKDTLESYGMINKDASVEESFFGEYNGNDVLAWPTNLAGDVRIKALMTKQKDSVSYAGYIIMFAILIMFSCFFTFTYFKRILSLAFLTIISPFVAMTYALDKLKDGSAQGFNNWFKEYIVNLLIQPIHLLLYTVLVSSAIQISTSNIIYGIVAIGFMIPAEKLIRRFFGVVNTTETQGLLAGPAGAALVMTGVNRILGHRPPSLSGNIGHQNQEKNKDVKDKINYVDKASTDEIFKRSSLGNDFNKTSESNAVEDNSMLATGAENMQNIPKTINNSEKNESPNIQDENINMEAWRQASDEEGFWNVGDNDRLEIGNDNNIKVNNGKISTDETSSSKKSNNKPKTSLLNGVARGTKFYTKGLARNIGSGIRKVQPGRKALRLASSAAVASLAGGIGLAAGAASGDPSKAFQYASSAAIAGGAFGSSTMKWAEGVTSLAMIQNTGEEFKRGFYGDMEYEEKMKAKALKKDVAEKLRDDKFIKDYALLRGLERNKAKEELKNDNFLQNALVNDLSTANEVAAAKTANEIYGNQEDAFRMTNIVKQQGSNLRKMEYDKKSKENLIDSLRDKFKANMPTDKNGKLNKDNQEVLERNVSRFYKNMMEVNNVLNK